MTRNEYKIILMMVALGTKLATINFEDYSFIGGALRVFLILMVADITFEIFKEREG